MLYKLHYFLQAAGCNALGILLGVYIATYTDATSTEIGMLYMLMPFIGMTTRPIICSMADRRQNHQQMQIICLFVTCLSYLPFVIIPLMGPSMYEAHPRIAWYTLVFFKVIGDIAFGGSVSLGDSLAINYAKRIGTDFLVYRIWGTISWMLFGIVVGQINEVWFLPKYVPGFMVLISCCLLNMFIIYLWPKEYFVMVTTGEMERENAKSLEANQKTAHASCDKNSFTRSLLPKEVVWAHIKMRFRLLLTCSCFRTSKTSHESDDHSLDLEGTMNTHTKRVDVDDSKADRAIDKSQMSDKKPVDKKIQAKILFLLLKRDPRIVPYLLVFIAGGTSVITLSFFFISLSEICHADNRCDFSSLGGWLQVSMAVPETILFLYVTRIIATIGRLNTLSIGFALCAIKYIFYGTIWSSVDPHYALLAELVHGIMYGIQLTVSVDMGHTFSSEVRYLIPELVQQGVVKVDDDASRERLELSLSATMQALVSSALDGLGRGCGALIYGFIIDAYSFETLWLIVGVGALIVLAMVQTVNLIDHCFHLDLGLEKEADRKEKQRSEMLRRKDNKLALIMAENGMNGPKLDVNNNHEDNSSNTKSLERQKC